MNFREKHKKERILFWTGSLLLVCFFGLLGAAQASAALPEKTVFQVDPSFDVSGRTEVSATLLLVGERSVFYVADDWWRGANTGVGQAIEALRAEFDRKIYPTLTRVYGSEWNPGIDDDPRVFVLITKLKTGAGGYFNSADEYPKSQSPSSNEREMLYLNGTYINSPQMKSYFAHEFQHMINFYQKNKLRGVNEDVWLNEALSEYAPTLCGYDDVYAGSNLERRVMEFLRNPSDPMTEWVNEAEDYSSVNLFMQYFVGRYGQMILTKIVQSNLTGITGIDQALADLGFQERFADIFTNWTIANLINNCQVGEGQRYCYLQPNLSYARLHVSPSVSHSLESVEGAVYDFSGSIKGWTGYWYEVLPQSAGLNLLINFSGSQNSSFRVILAITDFQGKTEVRFLDLNARQEGTELVNDFGSKIKSVILIPVDSSKISGFSGNDPFYSFSYSIKTTSARTIPSPDATLTPVTPTEPSGPAVNPNLPDGSLIRAAGDYKVYIVKGKYKRWIQTAKIFSLYPHLDWQSVIEVTSQQRDYYQDAWLVRADGDYKVYEVNGDLTKHWLNITADQFAQSGRLWDMVYVVNKNERDLYIAGAEVRK